MKRGGETSRRRTRTGLRNTSLDWKKALLAISRHHFLLLQCWDLQSLHLQITKTKTITARRMPCVAVHPLTYYHQTRQDKAKYYFKRASINQLHWSLNFPSDNFLKRKEHSTMCARWKNYKDEEVVLLYFSLWHCSSKSTFPIMFFSCCLAMWRVMVVLDI